MAGKKLSEWSLKAAWGANDYIVGYDPTRPTTTSNIRVLANVFATATDLDGHTSDNDIHMTAAQGAAFDAADGDSPSGANKVLLKSAADASYGSITDVAANTAHRTDDSVHMTAAQGAAFDAADGDNPSGANKVLLKSAADASYGSASDVAANTTHRSGAGDGAAAHVSGTDRTNWDAAYGWGDHSGVGYLTGAANLGAGVGIFAQTNGASNEFKTLVDSATVQWSSDANTISATVLGGSGWVDGTQVNYWVDGITELGVPTGTVTHNLNTTTHTLSVALDADRIINFTYAALAAGESLNWSCIIATAGFTPTWQVNGSSLDVSMDWYDIATAATYMVTFHANSTGGYVTGITELGVAA